MVSAVMQPQRLCCVLDASQRLPVRVVLKFFDEKKFCPQPQRTPTLQSQHASALCSVLGVYIYSCFMDPLGSFYLRIVAQCLNGA